MPTQTRRGLLYTSAAVLTVSLVVFWIGTRSYTTTPPAGVSSPQITDAVSAVGADTSTPGDMVSLARQDPVAFLEAAHAKYEQEVSAYRATLTKQELVQGEMTTVQQVELRYRKHPQAVFMIWEENADAAKRVLYKPDEPEYIDSDGDQLARVEPNGLARLVVSDIMMPIDGPRAKKASRHSIAFAGFGAFFDLLDKYALLAREHEVLDLRFAGLGEVDGRETIVIERYLPYEGEDGRFPDARLDMHFDRELLLPVAIRSYSDPAGTQLLGEYIYTSIDLNPNFGPDAFKF